MKKVICDTNVISRYILNSSAEITITIDEIIGIQNICITPVIYIELMNGSLSMRVLKGLSE